MSQMASNLCDVYKLESVGELLTFTIGKQTALIGEIATTGMYFGAVCSYCVICADYLLSGY